MKGFPTMTSPLFGTTMSTLSPVSFQCFWECRFVRVLLVLANPFLCSQYTSINGWHYANKQALRRPTRLRKHHLGCRCYLVSAEESIELDALPTPVLPVCRSLTRLTPLKHSRALTYGPEANWLRNVTPYFWWPMSPASEPVSIARVELNSGRMGL